MSKEAYDQGRFERDHSWANFIAQAAGRARMRNNEKLEDELLGIASFVLTSGIEMAVSVIVREESYSTALQPVLKQWANEYLADVLDASQQEIDELSSRINACNIQLLQLDPGRAAEMQNRFINEMQQACSRMKALIEGKEIDVPLRQIAHLSGNPVIGHKVEKTIQFWSQSEIMIAQQLRNADIKSGPAVPGL